MRGTPKSRRGSENERREGGVSYQDRGFPPGPTQHQETGGTEVLVSFGGEAQPARIGSGRHLQTGRLARGQRGHPRSHETGGHRLLVAGSRVLARPREESSRLLAPILGHSLR